MDPRLGDYVKGQWFSLVRFATYLCGDASEAEEIVQATLTKIVVRWPFIRDKDNPDAYVKRALARACIDAGKRRRREAAVPDLPDRATPDDSGAVADGDAIRRALSKLPPGQRAVLVLRFFDDASEATTAEVLRCSVGTVKSQTSKGLANLRAALGESVEISEGVS